MRHERAGSTHGEHSALTQHDAFPLHTPAHGFLPLPDSVAEPLPMKSATGAGRSAKLDSQVRGEDMRGLRALEDTQQSSEGIAKFRSCGGNGETTESIRENQH